jgi:hypothetical protein
MELVISFMESGITQFLHFQFNIRDRIVMVVMRNSVAGTTLALFTACA